MDYGVAKLLSQLYMYIHCTLVLCCLSGSYCVLFRYDTSLADGCIQLADRWAAATGDETDGGFTAGDLDTMSSNQIQEFLNQLHSKVSLSLLLPSRSLYISLPLISLIFSAST